VHPSASYASASPAEFEAHLDWLQANTDVVGIDDLLIGRNGSGRPQVALTFDDGYADNYEYAFEPLLARGMTATFFVTVGFLERDPGVMRRLAVIWRTPIDALDPLRWEQVEIMQRAGMTFGSHTWSHQNLAELTVAEAALELRCSRDVLEERLGATVDAVAYPFGKLRHHVAADTLRIAAAAGYTRGFVSSLRAIAARDTPLRLPRFGVGDDSVDSLAAKVRGEIDWHATVHERLPRRVDRVLFPTYP
jgi:peptidoglycan/xylan/chitin deacetylase (PgdA/CDA1 family)